MVLLLLAVFGAAKLDFVTTQQAFGEARRMPRSDKMGFGAGKQLTGNPKMCFLKHRRICSQNGIFYVCIIIGKKVEPPTK